MNIKNIELASISDSMEWNLHPYHKNDIPHALEDSIARIGVLHSPILQLNNDGQYIIICGYKRIQVLNRSQEVTSYPFRVLGSNTTPLQILHVLLEDQMSTGHVTLPEKAFFLSLCRRYFKEEEIIAHFFDTLQIRKKKHAFKEFNNLIRLESSLLKNIHNGIISDKILHELQLLSSEDRLAINNLFVKLQFSGSKQKRFYSMCKDYSIRSHMTITSILSSDEVNTVVKHPEMNRPQKVSSLMSIMQQLWAPLSSAAEENFKLKTNQMNLPAECSITPSTSFERDEVTLSTRFKNLKECQRFLPILSKFLENSTSKS